jgi:hypothetical protein
MTVSTAELQNVGKAATALGATAEIVGGWVWARFAAKPDQETIEKMKSLNYKWSKAKRRWYFIGAISTAVKRHSWKQIIARYTPEPIEDDEQ